MMSKMPVSERNQNSDENEVKSNDDTTDQQSESSVVGGSWPSPKITSDNKPKKHADTRANSSLEPLKAQFDHLEENCFENTSLPKCALVAQTSYRELNVDGNCSRTLNKEVAEKNSTVKFDKPSNSKQNLQLHKADLTSNKPILKSRHCNIFDSVPKSLEDSQTLVEDELPLLEYEQTPEETIMREVLQAALTNTNDAIAEKIVNDTLDCMLQNTPEGIAMGIVNELIDKLPDENIIYNAEYWDSGRLSQVLLDGSTVKRRSFLPYMPLTSKANFIKMFKQVFLPHGFPETVSADYAEYQVWDSLQAFFSTLTGALTTHSVMKGFGVGDAEATAASAAMTWLLRDGAGLVGRIIFAYWKGREFDMDCKKWRFFADILNDTAMFCECMIPVLTPLRPLYLMCLSTTMKSLVGVAGGATRAALTQHQAIGGNMADVSAKDQSQECCVNLIASVIGIVILMTVADSSYKWEMFAFFVFAHLICNYRAVKSVQLATLNTARFALIVRCYLLLKSVGSVKGINKHESVIIGRGYGVADLCGYNVNLGASFIDVKPPKRKFKQLRLYYERYCYILYVDHAEDTIQVFLKENATPAGIIKAFYHAIILAIATCMYNREYLLVIRKKIRRVVNTPIDRLINIILKPRVSTGHANVIMNAAAEVVQNDFPVFLKKLQRNGWDVEHLLFEIGDWRGRV